MIEARLVIISKTNNSDKVYRINNKKAFSVGTDIKSNIKINNITKVAKTQFRITTKENNQEYYLLNLGTNTFVNNQIIKKLTKTKLDNNDVIRIDDVVQFRFSLLKSVITPLSKAKDFDGISYNSGKVGKVSSIKNDKTPPSTSKNNNNSTRKNGILSSIKTKYTAYKKENSRILTSSKKVENNENKMLLKLSPTLNSINLERSMLNSGAKTPTKNETTTKKKETKITASTPNIKSIKKSEKSRSSPFISKTKYNYGQLKNDCISAVKEKKFNNASLILNKSKEKSAANGLNTDDANCDKRNNGSPAITNGKTETIKSKHRELEHKMEETKNDVTKSPILLRDGNVSMRKEENIIKEETNKKEGCNVQTQKVEIYNNPLISQNNRMFDTSSVMILNESQIPQSLKKATNGSFMSSKKLNVHLEGVLNKPLIETTTNETSINQEYKEINKILNIELIKSIIVSNTSKSEGHKPQFMDLMVYVKHFCQIPNDYKIAKVLIIQLEKAVLNNVVDIDHEGYISIRQPADDDSQNIHEEISMDTNNTTKDDPLSYSKKRKIVIFDD